MRTNRIFADGCGNIAAPQCHIEIGVLAAQKFQSDQSAYGSRTKRQKEDRFAFLVEPDDDKGRHAGV
jgi:hypothetical protein